MSLQDVGLILSVLRPCRTGWFGRQCSFMCQCENNATCNSTGACPGTCKKGYFGPGCQYEDLCYHKCDRSVPDFARDGNDQTCNTNQSLRTLDISTYKLEYFYWIRIVMKNRAIKKYFSFGLTNFNLTVNDYLKCDNERKLAFSNTIVDVLCDNSNQLLKLTITGRKVADICSVYISAGRSVAVKQPALQSSTYVVGVNNKSASIVVDGSSVSGCSRTNEESHPWWKVDFNVPREAIRIVLWTSNDQLARLRQFRVETRNTTGSVDRFLVSLTQDEDMHNFTIITPAPINTVRVEVLARAVLRLCEVLVYGEILCPDDTFGLDCERKCTCPGQMACNVATGSCYPKCPVGYYGLKCSNPCTCPSNRCRQRTGSCYNCSAGFMGENCTTPCPKGRFGVECINTCSDECAGKECNPATGACISCIRGQLPDCTACPSGRYGEGCLMKCPSSCLDDVCDIVTGACLACKIGRLPLCGACARGFHGLACDKECSHLCLDSECDPITGICLACKVGRLPQCTECPTGFYGRDCGETCPPTCSNGICESEKGACFACNNDFNPPYCAECPEGQYGDNCTEACPYICKHNICDVYSGLCHECDDNMKPPDCTVPADQKDTDDSLLELLIVVFAALLVMCALLFVCFIYFQRKVHDNTPS